MYIYNIYHVYIFTIWDILKVYIGLSPPLGPTLRTPPFFRTYINPQKKNPFIHPCFVLVAQVPKRAFSAPYPTNSHHYNLTNKGWEKSKWEVSFENAKGSLLELHIMSWINI